MKYTKSLLFLLLLICFIKQIDANNRVHFDLSQNSLFIKYRINSIIVYDSVSRQKTTICLNSRVMKYLQFVIDSNGFITNRVIYNYNEQDSLVFMYSKSKYNPCRIDTYKTEYIYKQNKVSEIHHKDKNGNCDTIFYYYDKKNRLSIYKEHDFKDTYTYIDSLNMRKVIRDSKFNGVLFETYYYQNSQNIDSLEKNIFSGGYSLRFYEYDKFNNCSRRKLVMDNGEILQDYKYYYSDKDKIDSSEFYHNKGWKLDKSNGNIKTYYFYNDKGLLIKVYTIESIERNNFIPIIKSFETYEYKN